MPKRTKRLTKRERQALTGKGPTGTPSAEGQHIHCIACGRHLDPTEFTGRPATAARLTCKHGSRFASCTTCVPEAQRRLDEHDASGKPPKIAAAWH